jgi:hypothetical protein
LASISAIERCVSTGLMPAALLPWLKLWNPTNTTNVRSPAIAVHTMP